MFVACLFIWTADTQYKVGKERNMRTVAGDFDMKRTVPATLGTAAPIRGLRGWYMNGLATHAQS